MVSQEEIYLVFSVIFGFGLIFGYLANWAFQPANRAFLMRRLFGKNYVLALIRSRGGQLRFHAVKHDQPTLVVGSSEYVPNDEFANYFGSVPCYAFDAQDCSALSFRAPKPDDKDIWQKAREPSRLHSIFMQMKALYEALANKNSKYLLWGIFIIGVLVVGALGFAYINYSETKKIGDFCIVELVKQMGNSSSTLVNQLK